MRKVLIFQFIFVLIVIISCKRGKKTSDLEYISVNYYFEQVHELEKEELIKQGVILDTESDDMVIANKYKKEGENSFNKQGYSKYLRIKGEIYPDFFKNYLYQQHLGYENEIFALYFTMSGYDDMKWRIVSCPKEKWSNNKQLDRNFGDNSPFTEILSNYDEGKAKNFKNARIFIEKKYLILERGGLYHSIYDLRNEKVVLNVENPYFSSVGENQNDWIRENLHEKIKAYLK